MLYVFVAALMLFHAQKDYNNYAGSQLVMAEVVDIEGASDENISVTYRYNIAGKEYESDKMQYLEKFKKGDTTISLDNLNRLCAVLEMQPRDIIKYVETDSDREKIISKISEKNIDIH